MKLEFEVIKSKEGDYAAACYKERIFTEGDSLQSLYDNIVEALDLHFEPDERPKAEDIQLIIYRECAKKDFVT